MDFIPILNGIAKAKKPLIVVRCRISPKPDDPNYNRWFNLVLTTSGEVRDTVVKRLQAEGFSDSDYTVGCLSLATIRKHSGFPKG